LSFIALFSDGELLVVATVIAAAIIGDLPFDFSGRNEVRSPTTIAVLCAISLLVVVISVLIFGLVTLDNQNRSDAEQQAQKNVTAEVERSAQLAVQSQEAQNRSNTLSAQAHALDKQATAAQSNYEKQLYGTGGAVPGNGPLAAALKAHADSLIQQSAAARDQANTLYHQALALRTKADQLLQNSETSLAIGQRQAAIMSVIMFPAAVLTGAAALWFSTKENRERRDEEAQPGEGAGPAEEFVLRWPEAPVQPASERDGEATPEPVSESGGERGGGERDGQEAQPGEGAGPAEQFVLRSHEAPVQPASPLDT
jgi:flagellar basal body-associated protein FliL